MQIDPEYTQADHEARENDSYANLKYELTLRWLKDFGILAPSRILNVGAGSGVFSSKARAAGYVVTDLEPDGQALSLANPSEQAAQIVNCDLFEYQPTELFDVIVMHDVLEHIQDDAAAVVKLHSLLCPIESESTPILIVSVPAWSWLFGYHDEQLGHYRRYSPSRLKRVLSTRFNIVKTQNVGLLGIPAAFWISRILRKSYPVGTPGLGQRIFAWSCQVEMRIPAPIGSSVMCAAQPLK